MVRIIRHDSQPMAHSHTSNEEINVANGSARAAQEGLEAAELLGSGLIDEQHLRSRRSEKGTHPCDIRLHASGVLSAKIELADGRDSNR